jgi:hypothetical protein
MAHPAHQFDAGDHVCTNQRVHRLHAGAMGTIQWISDTGNMFEVLFVGHRAALLMFHDQLETPPPQDQENEKDVLDG